MKPLISWLLLTVIGTSICLGQDTNIPVKFVLHSQTTTNWTTHTSGDYIVLGWGDQLSTNYVSNDSPDAYIGTIVSNNILDTYYNGKLFSTQYLNTNKVGELRVTWETKTIYHTNYVGNHRVR